MLTIRNLRRIEPLRRSAFAGEERRLFSMAMVSAPRFPDCQAAPTRRSSLGRAIAAAKALSEGGGVHPAPDADQSVSIRVSEFRAQEQTQLRIFGVSFHRYGKPFASCALRRRSGAGSIS